jgi:hypothetical protein
METNNEDDVYGSLTKWFNRRVVEKFCLAQDRWYLGRSHGPYQISPYHGSPYCIIYYILHYLHYISHVGHRYHVRYNIYIYVYIYTTQNIWLYPHISPRELTTYNNQKHISNSQISLPQRYIYIYMWSSHHIPKSPWNKWDNLQFPM